MQPTPNANDLAALMRLAQSPAGQQFLSALRKSGGAELQSAMAKAASGDYTHAQKTISAFLATPEGKNLLKAMENANE